jgi:catechol 2,3-dioxygenase-like lactoylglutathione lyase family enzyme
VTGTYLEHANITVPDIDAAIDFLRVIDPNVRIRHDEKPAGSYRWAHVAIGVNYIALQEPHVGSHPSDGRRPYKDHGVNHLGWVVEDLDKVVTRLEAKGYREGIPGEEHAHRRRAYYYDSAGLEWELVEYSTDNEEERFSY